MNDPMEPLRQLEEHIKAKLGELGMSNVQVAIIPNSGGPPMAQITAMFVETPAIEVPGAHDQVDDPEQANIDAAFEDLVAGVAEADKEAEVADVRNQLEQWLDGKDT